eukprot:gene4115-8174_t
MNLGHFVLLFTILWVLLYAIVYSFLLSPALWSNQQDSVIFDNAKQENGRPQYSADDLKLDVILDIDPFIPEVCHSVKLIQSTSRIAKKTVAVIIPVRNEDKRDVFLTVESLLTKSGPYLQHIIIVDDKSTVPINSWKEWKSWSMADAAKGIVGAVSLPHRLGVAGAKAMGAKLVIEQHKVDVVVFVDAHCVVSDDWLAPLLQTLEKNPLSIVYPAIDVIDPTAGSIIKADNVVGAFDWSLGFRWESPSADRIPLAAGVAAAEQAMSPATPGIFAMTSTYYNDIGGIHTDLKYWGLENIELSLRVWLCGGVIIRQPCSRVGHKYNNLHKDALVGNGVTQEIVDKNVMTVATQWFSNVHKETVFQARFTGRVPYKVEISLDAGQPKFLETATLVSRDKCQDFDWYLKEVKKIGLASETVGVEMEFRDYLKSGYLKKALDPILSQYTKKSAHAFNPTEIAKIAAQEKQAKEELLLAAEALPQQRKKPKAPPTDPHEIHSERVREELLCEDDNINGKNDCATNQKHDNACEKNPAYMIFSCPKTCNLCGEDGLICSDFFLKKCPEWKAEGQCDSNAEYMNKNCRRTCGRCRIKGASQEAKSAPNGKGKRQPKAISHKDKAKAKAKDANPNAPVAKGESLHVATDVPYADPTVLQVLLHGGLLADSLGEPCQLKNSEDAKLLDRIKVDRSRDLSMIRTDTSPGPKIFCGMYTMETKHKTNVRAVRDTWGKRCDGFMAFSTVNDPEIPAIVVPHEGPEDYNNMWQKSKSIWEYIGTHYVKEFDWFLMGGDDMFYIIENLKDYLGSEEIKLKQSEDKGMFVGRRFFPPKQIVFNSGGAGYLLDKKALQVLMQHIETPKCFPHQVGFWEDVNIAHCLKVGGDIDPYDTRDSQKRERFHPFTPGHHLGYRIPKNPDWYAQYNPELKTGFDCCSDRSISFHYCPADFVRSLAAYIYHCEEKDANSI